MRIAVVGGTGAEGFGFALRFAAAGHDVVIGSRDGAKAADAVQRATEILGTDAVVRGDVNADAVVGADVVIVTVPFAGQAKTYEGLTSVLTDHMVILDATSPLATAVGGKAWELLRPWAGSAAEQARAVVGDGPRLVSGFHTIAASMLTDLASPVDSDVLLAGDDAEAVAIIGLLADQIPGLRWVHCGGLAMARTIEGLTPLLISINRRYKRKDSGFRIVGSGEWGSPAR
ncbi:MAG: 8-hydroxy-5-deazaflavin:NADPH oxidoreductase [Actinomycetota bacterium]|jgi:NADPH-dependent F420 reductase|nr:8-hydroxy-5-deazaflavin:NADPH oxidoreductase [Actinomycetota bacterium]